MSTNNKITTVAKDKSKSSIKNNETTASGNNAITVTFPPKRTTTEIKRLVRMIVSMKAIRYSSDKRNFFLIVNKFVIYI
jgi:hypothetical protein